MAFVKYNSIIHCVCTIAGAFEKSAQCGQL